MSILTIVPPDRILADEHADRQHWLDQRRQYLTASDVPCLFGEGFVDLVKLAALKRGEVEPDPPNVFMRLGSYLEPFLFDELVAQRPEHAYQRCGKLIRDARQPRLAGTPDVVELLPSGRLAPVQLKYTAYSSKRLLEQLPPYFLLQVMAEIAVLDAPVGYVFALHKFCKPDDEPMQLYTVPRDDELVAKIRDAVSNFWAEEIERAS